MGSMEEDAPEVSAALLEGIRAAALPVSGRASDLDPLIESIGDARFVLLGEATHGTHEFYQARATLTRRLIAEQGFHALVVEADWPAALRVDAFVRGNGQDATAAGALGNFQRFPRWMWRNREMEELVTWMRAHNATVPPEQRAGFYGMDLYSLHDSMREVVAWLDTVDPDAAQRARERYACFDHFGPEPHVYGQSTTSGQADSCEEQVWAQFVELQRRRTRGPEDADARFHAEQNARLVANAEAYYRAVYAGRHEGWNLRDTHMADTVDALAAHLSRSGPPARLVIWAHNSHLGDARATQMGDQGELNVGQLLRERHGAATYNVGFTTYTGVVIAAHEWDEPGLRRRIQPAMSGSYERLFHDVGMPAFLLRMAELGEAAGGLHERRLERAIGVVYAPRTERWSHYFHANLPAQFDAVLHYDETRALRPLDSDAGHGEEDAPDTYPFGL
ncbi:erythromycin esterase family protein [Myxococcus xanthus DK 1622]|uniref:Erythromycin esterase family protein n=1 Tax=Myxococcus xanthus (strain DK1622) TaxID=246197 RepID=Q1DE34_MYXXD|nr:MULTISPECIES: erythromycin esterase family protein [Myxococcus]ABF89534.1 erythromycin esterase family protein [Myxococcus xanthus DK 1622]NOJ57058.1 erythromycin esterase family protein [Myxococcus xanthus]QPM80497.1 erythromycin esterase family protein [Myxococcus xanthus]QVW69558.1 erythromycin esterase family protein [Myxococcus xanthus DZ2]UEO04314.1 erythromycin esterase family protein [Myxococcus xanthus DZ2]